MIPVEREPDPGMKMIEIKASEKVTGKRWLASINAARRKVKDGQVYLIRRHGAFFRPDAHGYTTFLAAAGTYTAEQARQYLDVEGLSVVPLKSVKDVIDAQIIEAECAAARLKDLRAAIR